MDLVKLKKELQKRLSLLKQAFEETGRPKVDFSVYPEDMREHEEADYNAKILVEAARKIEKECGSGRFIVKIKHENIEKKFFTNANPIKEALKRVPKSEFPFIATIRQKRFGTGSNSTFYIE